MLYFDFWTWSEPSFDATVDMSIGWNIYIPSISQIVKVSVLFGLRPAEKNTIYQANQRQNISFSEFYEPDQMLL